MVNLIVNDKEWMRYLLGLFEETDDRCSSGIDTLKIQINIMLSVHHMQTDLRPTPRQSAVYTNLIDRHSELPASKVAVLCAPSGSASLVLFVYYVAEI